MAYTMSTASPILKEEFDSRVGKAISARDTTWSWFFKNVAKVDVSDRGYYFSVKTRRNQGYGSLTSAQEGGLMPRAGQPARQKVRADYMDHFLSGEITGRIKDAPDKAALLSLSKDAMSDAEDSFTTFQDFYLFGNGSGSLGVATSAYSGGSPTVITFALAQATPYGSMMIQPTQRVHFIDPATGTQRTGGSVTVSTVVSKNISTDVVTFDAVPTDVAINDIVVIEDTYGREMQGFDYHVNNSSTTWLKDGESGSAITRASNPWTNANVLDNSAGALSPALLDQMALRTENQTGDGQIKYDVVMLSHTVQQYNYMQLGYALTRVVNASGNKKLDLGFANVSHNGMEWRTSSHCQADRIYGLKLEDWVMPMVKKPQMYDFNGGALIQKPGTDRYYDASQFAVYARFNVICKAPFSQWLIKNIAFTAAYVRRNLN